MTFLNKFITSFICLLLTLLSSATFAAEEANTTSLQKVVEETLITPPPAIKPVVVKQDWYSVEYIIFKHNTAESQLTEPWAGIAITSPENPVFLNTPSANRMGIHALHAAQQQLYGVYSRLKKLNAYTPIRHAGWIQRAEHNSPVIQVSIAPKIGEMLLEGSISLRRGRYTHLDIDLQLTDANSSINYPAYSSNNTQKTYRLTETRRIKKGKVNYFDHPRFSVIAKIEKIDTPSFVRVNN